MLLLLTTWSPREPVTDSLHHLGATTAPQPMVETSTSTHLSQFQNPSKEKQIRFVGGCHLSIIILFFTFCIFKKG
jgi:hypothetical protein